VKWGDVSQKVLMEYSWTTDYLVDNECPILSYKGNPTSVSSLSRSVSGTFTKWFRSYPRMQELQIKHMMEG
jgi:hypothetical protein